MTSKDCVDVQAWVYVCSVFDKVCLEVLIC